MPRTRSSKPTAGPGSTISDATSYAGHEVEASTNEGLSQGTGQGLIESHCTYLAAVVSFVEGKTTPARAGRAHRSHSGCRRQKMSRLPGVDALAVMLPVQRGRQRHLLSYPRAQLARCGTATQLCHRFSRRPKGRLAHAQGKTCEHRLWCGWGIYSSCLRAGQTGTCVRNLAASLLALSSGPASKVSIRKFAPPVSVAWHDGGAPAVQERSRWAPPCVFSHARPS